MVNGYNQNLPSMILCPVESWKITSRHAHQPDRTLTEVLQFMTFFSGELVDDQFLISLRRDVERSSNGLRLICIRFSLKPRFAGVSGFGPRDLVSAETVPNGVPSVVNA